MDTGRFVALLQHLPIFAAVRTHSDSPPEQLAQRTLRLVEALPEVILRPSVQASHIKSEIMIYSPKLHPSTPPPALPATRSPGFHRATLCAIVGLSLGAANRNGAAQTCNIDLNNTQQSIDGFGACSAWYSGGLLRSASSSDQSRILEALFGQTSGIGLSIVRSRLPSEIEPAPGAWDWTRDDDAIWVMHQAQNYGVTTFFSTPWSPPGWMKTVNDINAYAPLDRNQWNSFAYFLSQYVLQYKSRFGITISAVSLANEPDSGQLTYECSKWDGTTIENFLEWDLASQFQQNGVAARVIAAESTGFNEDLVTPALNDSASRARLDIVGCHGYYNSAGWLNTTKAYGKPIWITEDSSGSPNDSSIDNGIQWALKIFDYLAWKQVNAYCYWWMVGPASDVNQGSLITQQTDGSFLFNKRLYTMGNYSRFIRPGYVMVSADKNPVAGISTSAFKNPSTGQTVIVAVNTNYSDTTVGFNIANFGDNQFTGYRTSSGENLANIGASPANGGQFRPTLAARSVTTFVSSAAQAGIGGMPIGTYKLISRNTGLALDNTGDGSENGVDVWQWDDSASWNSNQQWQIAPLGNGYYSLVCNTNGLALDNSGSTANGVQVWQWAYTASWNSNQQWMINDLGNGFCSLVCKSSGKALDCTNGSGDTTPVIQWDYSQNNSNQQWAILPIAALPNGTYKLINRTSGLALDNANDQGADGVNVIQWADTASWNTNQQWQITALGNGSFSLVCNTNGKALDNAGSAVNGGLVAQWGNSSSSNSHQQWQIRPLGNGYYSLVCVASGKALDNTGGHGNNTPVWQWDYIPSTPNQQWAILPLNAVDP